MVKSSSFRSFFLIGLLQFLAFRAAPFAQHSPEPHGASVAVPRLITINGVLKDSGDGQSLGGIVGVTFAFYKEQSGGAPLWVETQNVQLDANGAYKVLLGAGQREGLPMDLFTSGESRWLGVQAQIPGRLEQPRVLLVSVPYALKAADADRIGGRPASSFELATPELAPPDDRSNSLRPSRTQLVLAEGGGTSFPVQVHHDCAFQFFCAPNFDGPNFRYTVDFGDSSAWAAGVGGGIAFDGMYTANAAVNHGIFAGIQGMKENGTQSDFAGAMRFYTRLNNAPLVEQMRIDSSGNLGIRTTTPAAKLDVNGNGQFNGTIRTIGVDNPTFGSGTGLEIRYTGVEGNLVAFNRTASARVPLGFDASSFHFDTGNVGVGTTSPATRLQVVGDIRVGTSGTNGCIQGFDGSPLTGTCSSDMRLKQNIEPYGPVLNKVTQLQPVSYDWRAGEYPEYHFGSERTQGLIAQEVEKIFPNMVTVDNRGYKAVNYSPLPLLLLQAMKEQQTQIKDQQVQIQQLLTAVQALKAHLENAENR